MPEQIVMAEGHISLILEDQDFRRAVTMDERLFNDSIRSMTQEQDKMASSIVRTDGRGLSLSQTFTQISKTTNLAREAFGEFGATIDSVAGSIANAVSSTTMLSFAIGGISKPVLLVIGVLAGLTATVSALRKPIAEFIFTIDILGKLGLGAPAKMVLEAEEAAKRLDELVRTKLAEKAFLEPERKEEQASLDRARARRMLETARLEALEREYLILTGIMKAEDFIRNAEERQLFIAVETVKAEVQKTAELEQQLKIAEAASRVRGPRTVAEAREDFQLLRNERAEQERALRVATSFIQLMIPRAREDRALADDLRAFAQKFGLIGPGEPAEAPALGRGTSINRLSLTAPGELGGAVLGTDRQEQRRLERKRTDVMDELLTTSRAQLDELRALDFGLR